MRRDRVVTQTAKYSRGNDTLKSVTLECGRTVKLLSMQLTIPKNLKRLWAQRLSNPTRKGGYNKNPITKELEG